jgi:hypothetical protein
MSPKLQFTQSISTEKLPGFTAEASIYRTKNKYRKRIANNAYQDTIGVLPQRYPYGPRCFARCGPCKWDPNGYDGFGGFFKMCISNDCEVDSVPCSPSPGTKCPPGRCNYFGGDDAQYGCPCVDYPQYGCVCLT